MGLLCVALATGNTFAMAATIPPTVLLTRPKQASARFAAQIDGPCIISPLMKTVWLTPEETPKADALVFTSETGVRGWCKLHKARGVAYCVGDRTAAVAQKAGFDAHSAGGDAQDLIAMLQSVHADTELVHVRGRHVATEMGKRVVPYIVYDQEPVAMTQTARDLLGQECRVVLPFFSPRSVTLFVAQISPFRATLIPVAISAAVADVINDANLGNVVVADAPNADAMLRAVRSQLA